MDTNNTAVIAVRLSRRAIKSIAVIGVVACLAVMGLAAARCTARLPLLALISTSFRWITPAKGTSYH